MLAAGVLAWGGLRGAGAGQRRGVGGFGRSAEKLTLGPSGPSGDLVLTGEDGFGLRVTETLRFHTESYLVDHLLKVENRQAGAQRAEIVLGWGGPVRAPKGHPGRFQGPAPDRGGRVAGGTGDS